MDKQIDSKASGKQIPYPDGIQTKETENDIFKANDVLIFRKKDNSELVASAKGDGLLDFQNDFFNCCSTANTIYFWQDPALHLAEIFRVLKPRAKFTLALIDKNSGGKLPWTLPDFTFYKVSEVEKLFRKTGFGNIEVKQMTEEIISKDGKKIKRPFMIISGQKRIGLN